MLAKVEVEQAVVGISIVDFIGNLRVKQERQSQPTLRNVLGVYLLAIVKVFVVTGRGIWCQLR